MNIVRKLSHFHKIPFGKFFFLDLLNQVGIGTFLCAKFAQKNTPSPHLLRRTIFPLLAALACFFSFLAGEMAASANVPLAPNPAGLTPRAYIPILFNGYLQVAGLYGFVTQAGVPVQGVTLKLYKLVNTTKSILGTVVTDTKGYYSFTGLLGIGPGPGISYYVLYDWTDPGNNLSGRLAYWKTKPEPGFGDGQIFNLGNFDIADISLDTPGADVSSTLPVLFKWIPRVFSSSDTYVLRIDDNSTSTPTAIFTSPALGYVNNYIFDSSHWQAAMQYNKKYAWYVSAESPDGGVGYSRLEHWITFTLTP